MLQFPASGGSSQLNHRWVVRPPAPADAFQRFSDIPAPIVQVLYQRGLRTRQAVDDFLSHAAPLHNPFLMKGMTDTVRRLRQAIADGETVLVHGDFDADGVTSTVVMVTGLHALGANVAPYIPHRVDEGYGLNADAIHKMKARGINLMVTVDCGIRANAEIELANELGIEVLVTDHHSVPTELPAALAVVNPHQPGCDYPYKPLAGVGLAWKTIQALWLAERKNPIGKARDPHFDPNSLLELVAIGTVADVAPLTGENRTLVWRGLEQLRRTTRPGLLALYESSRLNPVHLTEESIGFVIGPRINAAGRLDHAILAYKLLHTPDPIQARQLAMSLEEKNRERQDKTKQALDRAFSQLPQEVQPLVMVRDTHCPEGIVGLVAGRLQEKFYRPAIVVSVGEELSRASCRSIPGFHITHALDEVSNLLERHGGHAQAAGFTVRTERLPQLQQQLLEIAHTRLLVEGSIADLEPKLELDGELSLEEITPTLHEYLVQLAPFGELNREPLWLAQNVRVEAVRAVGSNGTHLQLTFRDRHRKQWRGVAFRQGHRLQSLRSIPTTIDIAYAIKKSEWQGESRTELHITDFRSPLA
jgi:single-stranded-DNA-specific exonuclease